MPQSQTTAFSRHHKKKWGTNNGKLWQTSHMKPQTRGQRRAATEEPHWNSQWETIKPILLARILFTRANPLFSREFSFLARILFSRANSRPYLLIQFQTIQTEIKQYKQKSNNTNRNQTIQTEITIQIERKRSLY